MDRQKTSVFTFINHNLRDYPTPKILTISGILVRCWDYFSDNDCDGYTFSYAVYCQH